MRGVPSSAGDGRDDEFEGSRQIARLWLPLARRGHARAQYVVGGIYLAGKVTPRSFTTALKWFAKAADQGNADAQLALGLMYLRGQGVPRNRHKAAFWLLRAAQQGLVRAQCYVSRMYALGYGVQRSYLYGYMWAILAASGGNRSLPCSRHGHTALRNYALGTLTAFTAQLTRDEATVAVRMAKKWRQRFQIDLMLQASNGNAAPPPSTPG